MSEAILYDYWRSSACYRVRIALNLKRVPYRVEPVDLLSGGQDDAAYRRLNPQGLIPALAIDGHLLTQSLAIIDYLDATIEQPALVPRDPLRRARTLAQALVIAADVHPLNNLRVLNTLRSEFSAGDEDVRRWVQFWIDRGFAALEAGAPAEGLFGGDAPDLVDICLVPQMYNARRFRLELDSFPRLLRIDAALRALEPFARAAPEAVRSNA